MRQDRRRNGVVHEVAIMDIKPIRTEHDYDAALEAIEDA